ncbi:cct8, partial [Symbiodinium sp. KB8]
MANQSVSDVRSEEELAKALRPVLGAKQSGLEDILAGLVAKACVNVMPLPPKKPSINVDNVRVAKIIGGSIADSQVVKGLVVQRDAVGSVKSVSNAKIAVFGCPVEASSTETKGTVVIKNAEELKTYNKGEEQMIEEAIKGVADAGCNVIVSGGSISEMAMHFIEKYNLLALKIISKFELRRLCRAIGATACARLGPPMPEEIGQAASVSVQEIAGTRVTVFQQVESEDTGLSTIVLRGSTMSILDDLERAVDDGVNVAKALCKDTRLVPGAGATEIALSLALQKFGDATPGLEQYAINKFAQALEVVPRTLSENSGQNATDTLSALYSAHSSGKSAVGVCMEEGTATIDAAEAGIYDSFRVKDSAFRLATDAAITVMRVDQ